MSIKSKSDWLRGFIESLENSDSISQKQIKLLKERLLSLLEEIDDLTDEEDYEEDEEVEETHYYNKNFIIQEEEDDLPF